MPKRCDRCGSPHAPSGRGRIDRVIDDQIDRCLDDLIEGGREAASSFWDWAWGVQDRIDERSRSRRARRRRARPARPERDAEVRLTVVPNPYRDREVVE